MNHLWTGNRRQVSWPTEPLAQLVDLTHGAHPRSWQREIDRVGKSFRVFRFCNPEQVGWARLRQDPSVLHWASRRRHNAEQSCRRILLRCERWSSRTVMSPERLPTPLHSRSRAAIASESSVCSSQAHFKTWTTSLTRSLRCPRRVYTRCHRAESTSACKTARSTATNSQRLFCVISAPSESRWRCSPSSEWWGMVLTGPQRPSGSNRRLLQQNRHICDLAPCYKAQSGRRITHAAKRSRSRARWLSVESSSRLDLWWSMIFSETRYPLLRIML